MTGQSAPNAAAQHRRVLAGLYDDALAAIYGYVKPVRVGDAFATFFARHPG